MVKKVLGRKRCVDELEEDETIAVIQSLKENVNYLKNENTKLKIENKEIKQELENYEKCLKSCKIFISGILLANVITFVGALYMEFKK
jgi:regulator of replication initiation timing